MYEAMALEALQLLGYVFPSYSPGHLDQFRLIELVPELRPADRLDHRPLLVGDGHEAGHPLGEGKAEGAKNRFVDAHQILVSVPIRSAEQLQRRLHLMIKRARGRQEPPDRDVCTRAIPRSQRGRSSHRESSRLNKPHEAQANEEAPNAAA